MKHLVILATDRLLDAIEHNRQQPKDAQFVWTLSGYPMQQILWDGQWMTSPA